MLLPSFTFNLPTTPKSGYALIDSKDILPVRPKNTFQQQQVPSSISQNPFWSLYQEDASKLAYEAGKAQIEIGKTIALESIKTASSFERSQIRIDAYKFSDLFAELKELIPILGSKDCDLRSLKEEEQIFKNGIYNVKEGTFRSFKVNERTFGQFPINVNFVECADDSFPVTVFDKIRNDVFDGDMYKINLTYQILGAIMSNISFKHIFIFQGKSGAGKTTLTDTICSIIGIDKCLAIFDLSNLKDYTQEELNAYKLVVVKDTSDQAIAPKQLALLKNFADGNQRSSSNNFKVIINTNNSVYTYKDRETGVKYLNKALANRLVVLTFEKIMNKTYSMVNCDEYIKQKLYDEREYIISNAFKMFNLYYAKSENDRPVYHFCREFLVNAVIEDEVEIV